MAPNGRFGEIATQVLVVAILLIFVASVLGKLDGWSRWSALTSTLPLPRRASGAARLLVPAVEATVAVALLLVPGVGLLASSLLLAVFAFAVLRFAKRIGPAECGCFGALTPTKLGTGLAVRNVVLAAAAAVGAVLALQAEAPAPSAPALALGVVCGFWIVLSLEYVRLARARGARIGGAR